MKKRLPTPGSAHITNCYTETNNPLIRQRLCSFLLICLAMFFSTISRAQYPVKGTVTNDKGEVVPGMPVKVKNSSVATITDINGAYSISAPNANAILIFSNTGFITQEISVSKNNTIDIQLKAETSGTVLLNLPVTRKTPDVPLLYSMKSPANLNIASAQSVYGEDLVKMPGNLLKSALAGRLAGTYIRQSNGEPGEDAYSVSLRGQNPLVVIDGIPQNISIFDFDEIESVTVLRDALATAMYGPQASNGVLLVTTRKGAPGRQKISVTAQTGFQKSLKLPKALSAYVYAGLYNEALANDNISPVYTQADIDAYKNHTDLFGHPDVNWQEEALKKSTRQDRVTVNVSGGSKIARYYLVGEYLGQGGIFNTSDANKYNTNNDFKSYTVRSNIDVDIDDKTNVGLNILGRNIESNDPGTTTATLMSSIFNTPNNAYAQLNPDGSLMGSQQFQNNIYGQLNNSGYRKGYERDVLTDLHLKRNLDNITKGLWAKALISFSGALTQNIVRNKSFASYQMNINSTNDTSYTKFLTDGTQNNTSSVDNQWRQSYAEFDIGYNRQFGKNGIDAVILYSQNSNRINSDLPLVYKGLSGRMAYNYNKKYMAEVVFGYNGANRYPEGFRIRLFPAVGIGWNIHEESFMKEVTAINRLKLYGSYGKTGNNRNGYYSFNQYFFDGTRVYFGTTPSAFTTMDELTLSNPDLDYEKANKLNIGLEGALLKDRLSFSVEYYRNNYYDLLRAPGKSSTIIGNTYPNMNIGKSRYSGLEMNLGWSEKSGSFSYFVSANASIAKSEYIDIDEVYQPYEWMKRTGQPVGQGFGYTAVGFFQTAEDLQMKNGVATLDGYTPQLGDVMYKDLDGDGVITQFDEAPIGNTKPLVFFGTTLGASWKGVDFNALIQGAVNRNIVLTGASEWEFQNGGFGQAYENQLGRWTPGATNATYPRLTVGSNPNNHITNSSLWYHNGNYGRLKFVELGYTFSSGWVKKVHMESFRLFVNATNLFTLSAYDRVDPEVYGGAYPIQRVISTGLTIKL
ncbi:MAG: TonB-dependent receptor [Ferruginibacter sp.]|nr:TonB-dependent receptor [Ferruginibacter sp.]